MTRLLPYQYVTLRCVPRVEREEFCNVGVVAYCQEDQFLAARWHLNHERLAAFAPALDLEAMRRSLEYVDAVCAGSPALGVLGARDLGTRFGFLRAPRSTVLQPGPVHGGVAEDPAAELDRLLDCLVT